MAQHPTLPLLDDTHATLRETLDVMEQRERLRRRGFLLGSLSGAAALAALPLRSIACSLIPAETAGPYPGDGTNGPNALTQSGIVRTDIRASFGASGTAVAGGTPLTLRLRLVSTVSGCVPLHGLAVYLWHCNATGGYSMYSSGIAGQNYLRGVQVSDASGEVAFTSIFPGCYPGRWPHIHFEVYRSLALAVSGANAVRTSQLALPRDACSAVYGQTGLYSGSAQNLSQTSLAGDNVFGNDGGVLQLAATSGSNAGGYVSTLDVGVAVEGSDILFADGFQ
jgi:protocatechuate 3,4-dioxygenase beta subunit